MRTVRFKSFWPYGQERFDQGTSHQLDDDVAALAVQQGVADYADPGGSESSGGAGAGDLTDAERQAKIAAAMEQIGDDDLTADGRPKVDRLGDLSGFTVTAAERDTAWADYQARTPAA